MRGAVCFERPHFHFSESLSTELRFTAERLLGDERVRADGASVNLVIDQVRQLQHIDVADRDFLLERHTRHAIVEPRLACFRQVRLLEHVFNFRFGRAVEDRRCEIHTERLRRPAQMCFQNLTNVHSRRHAERIEDDLDRRSIRQVRHIFFRKNPSDHALVPVAPGHLVAHRQFALHRNINLHEFDDAWRQLITTAEFRNPFFVDLAQHVNLPRGHLLDFLDLLVRVSTVLEFQFQELAQREVFDDFARHLCPFCHDLASRAFVDKLVRDDLALK